MRQAVVVIHGMGEQKAMDFLRGFIDAAVPRPQGEGVRYRSKPDRMSESFEVRRLSAPGTRSRPITDFYEYYWAHHMTGNKVVHLRALVRSVFWRWPWAVSGSLRLFWFLGWAAAVTVGVLVVRAWRAGLVDDMEGVTDVLLSLGVAGLLGQVVRLVMRSRVLGFAVSYFGDVARYLDRAPENVEVRQKIRTELAALLRRIHESGEYDRIVVVGHSLGSVIAYDVLSFLYTDFNSGHGGPDDPRNEAIASLEDAGAATVEAGQETLKRYRTAQRAAWREQRRNGNPWLVTDFVSLGSPLAHAKMLLARSTTQLEDRKRDRELPTCPPDGDEGGRRYSYGVDYLSVSGKNRSLRVLHHGAVFGVTRWTNIYFPSHLGVFGDWFAGPVAPVFGNGITDTAVDGGSWTRFLPVIPHTRYFRDPDRKPDRRTTSITALRAALDLDSRDWPADEPQRTRSEPRRRPRHNGQPAARPEDSSQPAFDRTHR